MPLSDLIKSVLQGILQGITEWLPVSSTGHMILFQRVLGMHVSDTFLGLYLVVIQLGSALAVLLLYRKQLFPCLFDVPRVPAGRATAWHRTLFLWSRILVAVLPGALVDFCWTIGLKPISATPPWWLPRLLFTVLCIFLWKNYPAAKTPPPI